MTARNAFATLLAAIVAAPTLSFAAPLVEFDRCIEIAILPHAFIDADTDDPLLESLEMAAGGMAGALVARHFDAIPVATPRATVDAAPAAAPPGGATCGWQALWSLSVTGQAPDFVITYSTVVRHPVRGPDGAWTWETDLRYEHVMRGIEAFLASVPAGFGRDAVAQLEASQRIPGLHGIGQTTEDDIRAACKRVERALGHDFLVRTMTFARRSHAVQALRRLDQGESFESVGRALLPQADPASFAPVWKSPFEWHRVLTAAVVAVAPRGRVPTPVRSEDGWVVVEVDDRRSRPVAACGGSEAEVRRSLSK